MRLNLRPQEIYQRVEGFPDPFVHLVDNLDLPTVRFPTCFVYVGEVVQRVEVVNCSLHVEVGRREEYVVEGVTDPIEGLDPHVVVYLFLLELDHRAFL